ncbi:MAG: transcriptional regulator, LysR family [Ramlibacter sp.]|jgi:DNA-binding transcriptional LysR family regulator|uniref:LysR family transcriptional regulator n=1 Tax=Ramlibacter sp. TaxID=1917967 RepID=UPI002603AB1E|nr:LysR family transcriptional regulator [Ramlibacter sp.]MDB5752894.1 transcriptional regulator, LysR family [Ramlibacter sp.]
MNLSTRQLRVFLNIVNQQSFTRAAELSHITQAGISIMVREFERQVGARLFDRTSRAVALTEAGRKLVPVAVRVLRELDAVTAEIGQAGLKARGVLRVAATPLISSCYLPQALAAFCKANPGVDVRILDAPLDGVENLILQEDADVGLGVFFKSAPGLKKLPLGNFPLLKVSQGLAFPDTVGRVRWSALKDEKLVGLVPRNPIQKVIDAELRKVGASVDHVHSVNLFSTVIALVEAGFGSAVVPAFAIDACRRSHVRLDRLLNPTVTVPFSAVTKMGGGVHEFMPQFNAAVIQHMPSVA